MADKEDTAKQEEIRATFARLCAMPFETVRVLYRDRIARLAAELGEELSHMPEERLDEEVIDRFFGDVESPSDRHATAALIVLASPLAEKLEAVCVDLLDLAVKAAGQDVIAQAKRAQTTQSLSRAGRVGR